MVTLKYAIEDVTLNFLENQATTRRTDLFKFLKVTFLSLFIHLIGPNMRRDSPPPSVNSGTEKRGSPYMRSLAKFSRKINFVKKCDVLCEKFLLKLCSLLDYSIRHMRSVITDTYRLKQWLFSGISDSKSNFAQVGIQYTRGQTYMHI